MNGDGFADLIIGAPFTDAGGSNRGAAYVVFGAASGFGTDLDLATLTVAQGFQISGEQNLADAAISVSGAGDVNGDGFADLIIGASGTDAAFYDHGAAYVVFGRATGFGNNINLSSLNGTNGFRISGEIPYDFAGRSVSGAGDVNGDGFDDLVIGAPGSDAGAYNSGAAYVVYGRGTGTLNRLGTDAGQRLDGGDWDDTFTMRGGNDTVNAFAGDDLIDGGADSDTLSGGDGDDTIYGGSGGDQIDGGSGDDLILGGSGDDYIFIGLGADTARGGSGFDWLDTQLFGAAGGTVNLATGRAQQTGSADIVVISGFENVGGGIGNEVITGNAAANTLAGGDGNDTLDGGAGADALYGGANNDTYVLGAEATGVDAVGDTSGTDTITSTITRSLATFAVIEKLTLLGTAAINGTGNGQANVITGNAGNNELDGAGGLGVDVLVGLAGNDTYVFAGRADNTMTVTEAATGGIDTITSSITRSLATRANVENLTLLIGAVNGTGNALANTITGNSAANGLNGGVGLDVLIGGVGIDTLNGGDALKDTFRYLATNEGGDIVQSFDAADVFSFEGSAFGLGTFAGALAANRFVSKVADNNAVTADQWFIYNEALDQLWYDSNGSTAGGTKVMIADLTNNFALLVSDIVII